MRVFVIVVIVVLLMMVDLLREKQHILISPLMATILKHCLPLFPDSQPS